MTEDRRYLNSSLAGMNEEELEELDEAICLRDVSHMPTRVKCAVLGWHTLEEILKKPETGNDPAIGQ